MTTRFCCQAAVFVAVLSPLAFPSEAKAARLLSFDIRIDGKDHLIGVSGDNGEAPPIVVWRRLTFTELKPAEGVEVKSNPGDPLRATLTGNIEIEVSYGGKASVKELRLVRESPALGWNVDSRDVEQIAKDIGLSDAPAPSASTATGPSPASTAPAASGKSPWLWVGVGLAMALFASGLLVSWLRRRMPPPQQPVRHAELPFADPE